MLHAAAKPRSTSSHLLLTIQDTYFALNHLGKLHNLQYGQWCCVFSRRETLLANRRNDLPTLTGSIAKSDRGMFTRAVQLVTLRLQPSSHMTPP